AALAGEMGVGVDEAGQKRRVAEIDHLRARRRRAAHRFDLALAYDHQRGRDQAIRLAIEEPGGLHDDEPRRGGERGRQEEERREHGTFYIRRAGVVRSFQMDTHAELTARMERFVESLQAEICAALEALEPK